MSGSSYELGVIFKYSEPCTVFKSLPLSLSRSLSHTFISIFAGTFIDLIHNPTPYLNHPNYLPEPDSKLNPY